MNWYFYGHVIVCLGLRRESVAGEATNHLNQRGAEAWARITVMIINDSCGVFLPYITPVRAQVLPKNGPKDSPSSLMVKVMKISTF